MAVPMRKRPKPKESVIEKYLREQCARYHFMELKFTSPAQVGVPDRVVITPAATVFVELKRPGKDATEYQATIHNTMHEAGYLQAGGVVRTLNTKAKIDAFIFEMLEMACQEQARQAQAHQDRAQI